MQGSERPDGGLYKKEVYFLKDIIYNNKNIYEVIMRQKKTLLMQFIENKVKTLPSDPIRKGRPKGEAIGFSRKKNASAVLSLMNIPSKQIAELAGTTQASVLIWRGKEDFNNAVVKYTQEFVDELKPYILNRVEEAHHYRPTSQELLSSEPTCPEFTDGHLYSNPVRVSIFQWALSIEGRELSRQVTQACLLLFGSSKAVIDYLNSTLSDEIIEIKKLIHKRKPTKADSQRIETALVLFEQYLDMTREQKGK